jgi:hypothetical protein
MKTFKQLQLESALSSGLNRGFNEPSKQTKIKIKQHNAAVAANYPENHPYRLDKAPYGHKFNKSGKIVITNEDYDIESMLEYIEELEAALDESGNPFKRLDSLEFQTKSKAAVDSLKGDKKKENLHNSQLKRLSSVRNKLATEETD